MKANELMIGDWVLDGDNVAQVTSITCDGIIETTFNENSNIEVIYPIPLTTKILEKNGFIKENGCWVLRDKHTGDKIISLFEVAKGFAMPTSGLTIGFQEVHKFQHLLELCGIDKTIEL